jgi:hypothetical protein
MSNQRAHKTPKPMTRLQLMRELHREIASSGRPITSRDTAPLVFELADKAKAARGRSVIFRGVKFKLKIGLWLNVCDESGDVIFSTSGGVL